MRYRRQAAQAASRCALLHMGLVDHGIGGVAGPRHALANRGCAV